MAVRKIEDESFTFFKHIQNPKPMDFLSCLWVKRFETHPTKQSLRSCFEINYLFVVVMTSDINK